MNRAWTRGESSEMMESSYVYVNSNIFLAIRTSTRAREGRKGRISLENKDREYTDYGRLALYSEVKGRALRTDHVCTYFPYSRRFLTISNHTWDHVISHVTQ